MADAGVQQAKDLAGLVNQGIDDLESTFALFRPIDPASVTTSAPMQVAEAPAPQAPALGSGGDPFVSVALGVAVTVKIVQATVGNVIQYAISEAKERFATMSESIDDAYALLSTAQENVTSAWEEVKSAAGDTGHPRVDDALEAFASALNILTSVGALALAGKIAGNEYAEGLG